MLIEYKIKFEKGGVTVTQRVEPNSPDTTVTPTKTVDEAAVVAKPGASKQLEVAYPGTPATLSKAVTGAGPVEKGDTGEGDTPGTGTRRQGTRRTATPASSRSPSSTRGASRGPSG